jgi:hypothetical protein
MGRPAVYGGPSALGWEPRRWRLAGSSDELDEQHRVQRRDDPCDCPAGGITRYKKGHGGAIQGDQASDG